MEAGNEALKRGDFSNAIEYYKQAIKNEPAFSEYVNLGHCYAQLEQWGDASSAYEEAIKLKPEAINTQLYCSLGRAYFENKKYEQAKEVFAKAFSLEPANSEIELWIARCLIELKQWIESESILLGRFIREPDDTVTLELLAYVYNQHGNISGIITIYRKLVDIKPQNMAYRITLAKILKNDGQNKQAIDVLEFARKVDLDNNTEISRILGDLYLAENMPREAIRCYKAIMKNSDKYSADYYYRLGIAYFLIGDYVSSGDIFNAMRKSYPEDFRADLYLGSIFAEKKSFEQAMNCYRSAIVKNYKSIESYEALAELEIKNNLYSNAAGNLLKAIELGDNRSQVYYNYLFALVKEGDSDKIKAAFKTAFAEYPSSTSIRHLLNQYIKDKYF